MKIVSVIVPVYNLEHCLIRCLESLVNQSYSDFEVILIDDGSTDDSYNICNGFSQKDSRFCVMHYDNHGVSFARNRGLEKAMGDYVMFVDGDDEILSDMLMSYVSAIEKSRADVVIGGLTLIEEDGGREIKAPAQKGTFSSEFWNELCKDNSGVYGYVSNKLYRRQLLENNKIRFREDMTAQEDLAFALSAYEKSKEFCLIEYSGYLYYRVPGKRRMPIKDLLENQIKLQHEAKAAGALETNIMCVIDRIQGMVYNAAFGVEDEAEFGQWADIDGLKDILKQKKICQIEKKWIISLFIKEKYAVIYQYFQFRKKLKRILRKENC